MTPGTEELPTEMGALADRCEQATGPDRELDRAIKNAIGDGWDYAADWGPRENCNPVAKAYTASLDAAMTLAQPNWWFNASAPLSPDAYGYSREDQRQPRAGFEMIGEPYSVGARASTIALAICAAALRARAQANPIPNSDSKEEGR